MKYISNLFVLSIFFVCNNNDNKKATYTNKNIITLKSTNRIDSLVNHYIKTTNNELVKINKKNIEWFVDNTAVTDSNKFHIIHIGHQQRDENISNPIFVTDGWIYIDSSKSKIYECDLPNDSLIFYK